MTQTVREFITDCYSPISASSPTVPLHGNDLSKGVQFMNELLAYYAANGLLMTVNKEVSYTLVANTENVTFGVAGSGADLTTGYLSYVQSAWVVLDNVTYPLIATDRNIFDQSFKYSPLPGLPRFFVMNYGDTMATMRIYPRPSQEYTLYVKGKFSIVELTTNDDMSVVPFYLTRWLRLAVSRDVAFYKGRQEAWTDKLEMLLREAENEMIAATPMNVKIFSDRDAMLNGADRVRAGV